MSSTNSSANTSAASMPVGWTQVPWFNLNKTNITTANTTGTSLTVDFTHFERNILSAWTATNKGQIDDIIGVVKNTGSA